MTKYSTILGAFQQPWPEVSPIRHFEQGEGPGDEGRLFALDFLTTTSIN